MDVELNDIIVKLKDYFPNQGAEIYMQLDEGMRNFAKAITTIGSEKDGIVKGLPTLLLSFLVLIEKYCKEPKEFIKKLKLIVEAEK